MIGLGARSAPRLRRVDSQLNLASSIFVSTSSVTSNKWHFFGEEMRLSSSRAGGYWQRYGKYSRRDSDADGSYQRPGNYWPYGEEKKQAARHEVNEEWQNDWRWSKGAWPSGREG